MIAISVTEEGVDSWTAPLGFAYAKTGRRERALKIIEELDLLSKKMYVPAQERAVIYVGLGDFDKAFEYLRKSCNEKFPPLPPLLTDPIIDDIKSDARLAEIKNCVKL